MPDVIKLLPDAIANQIAAGEVIQRPASAVKELMENALDAGADSIQVIIRDAGKALIQIVDNGSGMTGTDARMSFERHATSKIRSAEDLFAIRTMGFRGEALASISAIAHVELRTRKNEEEIGTRIVIDGSTVTSQEPCQTASGTTIVVKNLFYNVPARRKFLKSDPVEFRHITDEFSRVALAHPEIAFSLHHNDNEVVILPKSNLRQRIVNLLGKRYNELIVPVSEETNYLRITGFVGKPEAAKKARGDQYIYVNQRFIRSPYLHHAIRIAFEEMIPEDAHPLYVLFLEVDPARIDVNVHPTKQEIKFEDERLIYNYLRVTIRHALGKYSVTPSLDFEQEQAFQSTTTSGQNMPNAPSNLIRHQDRRENIRNWELLYQGLHPDQAEKPATQETTLLSESGEETERQGVFETLQIHGSFVVAQTKSGMLVIDQQAAHQRILYERYLNAMEDGSVGTQKLLFPETFELSPADSQVLLAILDQVNGLGFDVQEFGGTTFVMHGVPAMLGEQNAVGIMQSLIEKYVDATGENHGTKTRIARAMSESASLKAGDQLASAERLYLIDSLFACENPYTSPSGRRCYTIVPPDELYRRISRT